MFRARQYARMTRFVSRAVPRLRAGRVNMLTGFSFAKVGARLKLYGACNVQMGEGVRVGDFCWIEAVTGYANIFYQPHLEIGSGVAISDLTHISCVSKIVIGRDCLIGSKVYIGDHSHGPTHGPVGLSRVPPGKRELSNIAPISIGERSWIGDGAVILAGANIPAGSIIGANSIVAMQVDRPALLAGTPARVVRYLD